MTASGVLAAAGVTATAIAYVMERELGRYHLRDMDALRHVLEHRTDLTSKQQRGVRREYDQQVAHARRWWFMRSSFQRRPPVNWNVVPMDSRATDYLMRPFT
jgi:hypothetical protein